MVSYLLRRLAMAVFTLLVITCIVYGLIRNIPGTPLTMDVAEQSLDRQMTDEQLRQLERIYGLDQPWPVAYVGWLGRTLQGDLGRSFRDHRPVSTKIGERLGRTFLLSGTSLFLVYVFSVPIGIWATARSGKLDERIVSTLLYMLYAVPTFVAGLLMLVLFYQNLADTPFYLEPGMMSPDYDELSTTGKIWDVGKHLILPLICFTYGSLAYDSRFVKSNMEEVVRQDYIRTAKAKGVGPTRILFHHAFRNTLIPFVTLIGLSLPALVGGSIVIERIFNWPGIGDLYLNSIAQRDYPTIMGLTLMFSVLTLTGQLLADILYAFVDPRVTYN
jgi:peptide/nickel transport system permease protein